MVRGSRSCDRSSAALLTPATAAAASRRPVHMPSHAADRDRSTRLRAREESANQPRRRSAAFGTGLDADDECSPRRTDRSRSNRRFCGSRLLRRGADSPLGRGRTPRDGSPRGRAGVPSRLELVPAPTSRTVDVACRSGDDDDLSRSHRRLDGGGVSRSTESWPQRDRRQVLRSRTPPSRSNDQDRPRSRSGGRGWTLHRSGNSAPPRSDTTTLRASTHERSGDVCPGRPHALFLMGLPGAGKTTVKRERLRKWRQARVEDIEPDQFKRRHPRYSEDMGDGTDDEVHRWSVRRSVDAFEDVVQSPARPDVVLDSSGSNVQWLRRRIVAARNSNYYIKLLWVDVPTEIALLRNRDRAAFRGGRTMVPDRVIMDKASVISSSFEELRREADSVERLQNWCSRDDELERAKLDIYVYPPPRTRPPGIRSGESGYGKPPRGARTPSPTPGSRRNLRIGPWKRGDDVMREKNKRLEWMDRQFKGNRERFVLENVLGRRDVLVEPNRYPYQLPPDVEHWTIWNRKTMQHQDVCEYIEGWLQAREPHNVMSWNYDDNRGQRTIDIWHVHVYFRGHNGNPPGITRSSSTRPALSASRHRSSPCSV